MNRLILALFTLSLGATPWLSAEAQELPADSRPATEDICTDGLDNDGDGLEDCGDADCFEDASCAPDGLPENTDKRCSDWVDNDKDGHIDCDDFDCGRANIDVCKGSWDKPMAPPPSGQKAAAETPSDGTAVPGTATGAQGISAPANTVGAGEGIALESLIGQGGDNDGERNDYVCSDGIDNDDDGSIDCADIGCQFDTSVTVCSSTPGMRFSVVAGISAGYYQTTEYGLNEDDGTAYLLGEDAVDAYPDVKFERLQLRALGPIPLIQDSFFLISSRAEKDFRVTFALFQMPIFKSRHMVNINSGGGGLSQALIISAAKQLLLEQPYYMYNAFDQGNGAAIELSGPLTQNGRMTYRTFLGGGTGRWNGALGGRYFGQGFDNFTYAAGGQLGFNIFGYYSRFDNPFIYTPVPLTWGVLAGAKYDQRNDEQYSAFNVSSGFRYRRLVVLAETYAKKDLYYDLRGLSYNIQAAFLLVPRKILLAADYGAYTLNLSNVDPADLNDPAYDLNRERSERQWRAGAHYYFFRNVGILSMIYSDNTRQLGVGEEEYRRTQEVRLEAQYRF